MKLYRNVCNESFWNKNENWALKPTNNLPVITPESEKGYAGERYVVEYEMEELPVYKLLELMYHELSISDVKTICEKEKKIEQLFLLFIARQ